MLSGVQRAHHAQRNDGQDGGGGGDDGGVGGEERGELGTPQDDDRRSGQPHADAHLQQAPQERARALLVTLVRIRTYKLGLPKTNFGNFGAPSIVTHAVSTADSSTAAHNSAGV